MSRDVSLDILFRAEPGDAATRHLRGHADGSPLFPGGSLLADAALARRARSLDAGEAGPLWGAAADAPAARRALAEWLATQPANDAHPAQRAALTAAAAPDALFVLTGQQPGLLGGPFLTLCKALTAVELARRASERLGRPVIPVFWAAGDDSDLAESNAVSFLEPDAPRAAAALSFAEPDAAIPMSLRVPAPADVAALLDALPPSWSGELRALAAAAYAPGRSLTQGFLALLSRLLGPRGLLFVDGFDAARRPAAQELLRRIALEGETFHDAALRGTTRLRETLGAAAQVPVRAGSLPVFLLEEGRRERLYRSDSGRVFTAGNEAVDLRATLADRTLLHSAPNDRTLLHSALSRPLVVETLFPVLGHVLGPAELRYFAQLTDVFVAFGFRQPPLAARAQAMLAPDGVVAALAELGFGPSELHALGPTRVRARLAERAWDSHPAAADFPEEAYRALRASLLEHRDRHFPGAGVDGSLRRLDRAFARHREAVRALAWKGDPVTRFQRLQPAFRWLAGGAQDRHLNLLSALAAIANPPGRGAPATCDDAVKCLSGLAPDGITVYRVPDPKGLLR